MKPLQEKAYDFLLAKILHEELVRGKVYSEAKTAEDMGMSRTPVRAALQRLSQDKYIDILASRGFRIHEITERDIIETFQMRSAIEGYSAIMIARNIHTKRGKETIEKLRKNIEHQRNIVISGGKIEDFLEVDLEFHAIILEYSQNLGFMNSFNSSINLIRTLARLSLSHEGRMPVGFEEHEDVYKAIAKGNVDSVFELIERCMENPKSITLLDIQGKKETV